jgi:hypothetical protein
MKDALYVPGLVEKIMSGVEINNRRLSELGLCERVLPLKLLDVGISTIALKHTNEICGYTLRLPMEEYIFYPEGLIL